MSFIHSNQNRLYAGIESSYGMAPPAEDMSRLPLVRLNARQQTESLKRINKSGSRTFTGVPQGSRKRTRVELRTHLSKWLPEAPQPSFGALLECALGGAVQVFAGGTLAGTSDEGRRLQFQAAHGLTPGQGIAVGNQVRFVTTVPNATSIDLNAPFRIAPPAGAQATRTATFRLGSALQSVSLLDCWSPAGAIERLISGFAIDEFAVDVNSDFHEFHFAGPAHDLFDSHTFLEGEAGLAAFPEEPDVESAVPTLVPGHLGEAIVGELDSTSVHLTRARIQLRNNIDVELRDFGADRLRDIMPGFREVLTDFELCAATEAEHSALYAALRHGDGFPIMMQLGQRVGELFALYMPSIIGEVPQFDDSELRLRWRAQTCRAQGSFDDELVVAVA